MPDFMDYKLSNLSLFDLMSEKDRIAYEKFLEEQNANLPDPTPEDF